MKKNAALAFGTLGVVFGDIGTSPLYALTQCFQNLDGSKIDPASVMGILSLVFWSLVLVVCVKYATFVMRADHEGEGGTLAMLALIHSKESDQQRSRPGILTLLVLFGSALLYGDGIITPSISVISAVEGLQVASPAAKDLVVPLSVGILIGLFLFQYRGTARISYFFAPVMALWFLACAVLGVRGICKAPQILAALNPGVGAYFLFHHGFSGLLVLGGVVLCLSGAEALFADLGHFGRLPITLAWYWVVLPSLLINYFGQGALLILHPELRQQPYFSLVPQPMLYPMVLLATLATVIASQALISAVFSLTQQAISMGYCPRFEIVHTSPDEKGQIYVPTINYLLMIACVVVIVTFKSSANLGNAYGLAVIGTMTITSITYYFVLRRVWNWPTLGAASVVGAFLFVDSAFLTGNLVKLFSGAWVPIAFAGFIFAAFWIWTTGRLRYQRALEEWSMPIPVFTREMSEWQERLEGTAVFLSRHDSVPLVGKNQWLHDNCKYEQVLLVTVLERQVPLVAEADSTDIEQVTENFWKVTSSFGFLQHPDVSQVLKTQSCGKLRLDWSRLVFFLPEPVFVKRPSTYEQLVQSCYCFLVKNSLSPAEYFRVPPRDIIHVGIQLDI